MSCDKPVALFRPMRESVVVWPRYWYGSVCLSVWLYAVTLVIPLFWVILPSYELSLRRHRTRTTKYNRLVQKFRHRSTRLCVRTQVYQIQWNNAMQQHFRGSRLNPPPPGSAADMVEECGHKFLSFCHNVYVWQTDGRTDRKAFAIPCIALYAVAR